MSAAFSRLAIRSVAAVAALLAQTAAAAPSWDATIGTSVGFDSNIYLAETGPLANRESAVVTLDARVGLRFADGPALAYSAVASEFLDAHLEDNVRHTLSASWTRRLDSLSWRAATEFALVDGDDRGVDYGSGIGSAYSTAAPRERRDQFSNKTDLALRLDRAPGFVRLVGKLQAWDMRTSTDNGCNYVDRHDVNGGLDLGRPLVADGPEIYLGYRRGRQFQDNDSSAAGAARSDASNHYDRVFIGIDGAITRDLRVSAQIGWSTHNYDANYAGVDHEEGLFLDIAATWRPDEANELALKTVQARTFSTTGRNSVLSTSHTLSWTRTLNERWSVILGARVSEAEYAPVARDDIAYAVLASLVWRATDRLTCTLSASHDRGRDNHNDIAGDAAANREFDRAFVSLGAGWKL